MTAGQIVRILGGCAGLTCGWLLLVGCSSSPSASLNIAPPVPQPAVIPAAKATIERRSGDKKIKGTVRFIPQVDGVKVIAILEGLKPNGTHGFHVHEKGDCSAADASSAGGHFNPDGMPHADPSASEHHVGDMGNIQADKSGRAHIETLFKRLSLDPSHRNYIVGKAVVVHAKADDLKSQPAGDAGPRIGCGVIEVEP